MMKLRQEEHVVLPAAVLIEVLVAAALCMIGVPGEVARSNCHAPVSSAVTLNLTFESACTGLYLLMNGYELQNIQQACSLYNHMRSGCLCCREPGLSRRSQAHLCNCKSRVSSPSVVTCPCDTVPAVTNWRGSGDTPLERFPCGHITRGAASVTAALCCHIAYSVPCMSMGSTLSGLPCHCGPSTMAGAAKPAAMPM